MSKRGFKGTTLHMLKEKEVERGAWPTFFAGINVWKSEDSPGWQKAEITAVMIDCCQISYLFFKTGESETVEKEVSGALASLPSAESACVFSVMNQLHLGF